MAQKPLFESTAKKLIAAHWEGPGKPLIHCATVHLGTTPKNLLKEHPWLKQRKLVAKVDELFGKRSKLGYVKVAENFFDAWKWIEHLRGKEVAIGGRRGRLNHFLIEPFIPHTKEYYLALTCERESDVILFSEKGGIDIEEQGDSVHRITVPFGEPPNVSPLSYRLSPTISGLLSLFRRLDLSFLEINPLTEVNGIPYLLDTVCRVDSCAAFRQRNTWGSMDLPQGFGVELTPEERAIHTLDAQSGSSLKFVLLNPQGRIWTMVAGGGASIIYADAITSLAPPHELANYGEWSGNPTTDEMEAYTRNILSLMTKNRGRQVLMIGGGIANFTNVQKTFAGVIKALHVFEEKPKNVHIFVRRAGPNDRKGLEELQKACDAMGIFCRTYGAELPMTEVVEMAIADLGLEKGTEGTEGTKGTEVHSQTRRSRRYPRSHWSPPIRTN